jgi:hypothetical protein
MPFRRVTSTGIGASPPPLFNRWCWEPACCNGQTTWVRTRLILTFGGAKTCGLNLQFYDSGADPGYYRTINGAWTRKWRKNLDDSVVDTCEMTLSISKLGPSYVRLVGEACEGSTSEASECPAPDPCSTPPGCYLEDTPVSYEGSGIIGESVIAAGARANQTVQDSGWGTWEKGTANIIGGGHQARDTRSIGSASFSEIEWQLEFGGIVREHQITWIETIQPLPSGSPTTSERSLHITGPGSYSLRLVADPNTTKTMGNIMLAFAIP